MIIGIDPSLTHIGIACISKNRKTIFLTIEPKNYKDNTDRLLLIYKELDEFVSKLSEKIDLVVIEGGAFAIHAGRLYDLGECSGAIKLYFALKGVKIVSVPPLQVKKFLAGTSKIDKPQLLLKAYKKWRIDRNEHETVAYTLASIGYVLLNNNVKLTKYEKEVIDYIRNKNAQILGAKS